MGNGTGLKVFRVLAVAFILAAPAAAYAHARLVNPAPRSTSDGIKSGPCGNLPRGTSFVEYEAGATVTVDFREGIDHSGCFDILFSPYPQDSQDASVTGWTRLKRIEDEAGTANTNFSTTVTLPPGVTCEKCTLALRQVMMPTLGPVCQPATNDELDGGPPTYFSCADIRIGSFPDAAPSVPDDDGGDEGSSSGGPSTVPTDGGGNTVPEGNNASGRRALPANDDGCSVGWGATSGFSLFASIGLGALAIVRRRRRSSDSI